MSIWMALWIPQTSAALPKPSEQSPPIDGTVTHDLILNYDLCDLDDTDDRIFRDAFSDMYPVNPLNH